MFAVREGKAEACRLGWQTSLFGDGGGGAARPGDFADVRRHRLDASSWVDHAPGWLGGADGLFDRFLRDLHWEQRQRAMYEAVVWEPRLTAAMTVDAAPDDVLAVTAALGRHYRVEFDLMWLNLYRDGSDSVAWHGDRIQHQVREPLVAIVSLGATRTFALRPKGGGAALRLASAHGDLIVMGGRCQHDWEHTVAKTRRPVGPRISFTARHSAPRR